MRALLYPSSLIVASLVALGLLTSTAPLWLLLPALLFATAVGLVPVLERWLRRLAPRTLRALLIVPALGLIFVSSYAFAARSASPWILLAIFANAVVAVLIGAAYVPVQTRTT